MAASNYQLRGPRERRVGRQELMNAASRHHCSASAMTSLDNNHLIPLFITLMVAPIQEDQFIKHCAFPSPVKAGDGRTGPCR